MADDQDDNANGSSNPERQEISQLVKCRMQSLGQPLSDYGKIYKIRYNLFIRKSIKDIRNALYVQSAQYPEFHYMRNIISKA